MVATRGSSVRAPWAEMPSPRPERRDRRSRGVDALHAVALVVVAVVPAVARTVAVFDPARAVAVGAITATGLAAHRALRDRPWWARLGVAALAGAVAAPLAGEQTGAWVASGIVLAAWAVRREAPAPGLPEASGDAIGPVVVLSLVAAWREQTHWGWIVLFTHLAVSVGAVLLTARFRHLPQRFGHAVGRGVVRVLFALVAVITVVVPGLVFRLLRIDPLASGAAEGTQWSAVRPRELQATRPWVRAERVRVPLRARPWPQKAALAALVVVVAGIGVRAATDRDPGTRRGYSLTEVAGVDVPATTPDAFAGADWYPKYQEDLDYASTWIESYVALDGVPLPDLTSRYLNVRDGVRLSWAPPACDCRRLTVWVYGASTTFGLGQRDDHTIPSELARAAWEDGIALDVVNRGVPGEQHWQEANRLRWDLTRHDPPDLVVFYDGASDVVGASWLDQHGLGDPDLASQPLTEEFLADPLVREPIDEARRGGQETPPPAPGGLEAIPPTTVGPMTPEEVGALAVSRYDGAREMSRDLAAIHDLPTTWFWQPTRFSRPPIEGEPTSDVDERSRAVAEAAAARVPDEVVDLSDVLDDEERPIFSDDVHHNELGAQIVAAAMYDELRPQLEDLAG